MQFDPLAFVELFVVLAFAIAWAILEFVASRFDKKRGRPQGEKSDR